MFGVTQWMLEINGFVFIYSNHHHWLVVDLPLWKIWKSIGMMTFPIYGKIYCKMFQTTIFFHLSRRAPWVSAWWPLWTTSINKRTNHDPWKLNIFLCQGQHVQRFACSSDSTRQMNKKPLINFLETPLWPSVPNHQPDHLKLITLQSSNIAIGNLPAIYNKKSPFRSGIPAGHVWWHQRVMIWTILNHHQFNYQVIRHYVINRFSCFSY